jgi:glycopeptide antibiotics resistance protein
MVVMRITFFPFEKIEGKIQPLLFSFDNILPFRINLVPFINFFDYPEKRSAWLNVIGNTTMFIPIGIIWPTVFKKLDNHKKVILSGIGFSAFVEILQLPFFDRVTDIDDLILNSIGFAAGYLVYLLVKKLR